jgi:Biotin-protein ligase, N terminal
MFVAPVRLGRWDRSALRALKNLDRLPDMVRIAVFRHDPFCSRACADAVAHVLAKDYDVDEIGLSGLTESGLSAYDLVVFPGGEGDADRFHGLLGRRRTVVQNFIDNGGAYLGICMGAYWAGRHYFSLLPNTDCVQYIARPRAEIRRSYKTALRVTWDGAPETMFFYDGCTFLSRGDAFETIATYANGDPMAILAPGIGLIGCHPESARGWYDTPSLKLHWHRGIHHDQLRDFVKRILQSRRNDADVLMTAIEEPETGQMFEPSRDNLIEEIQSLRATLEHIEKATAPFAHGTLQSVHRLAREGLRKRRLTVSHDITSNHETYISEPSS